MTDQLLQLLATQAWQIAALAIVVALLNRTVAKNRPHLAHALWMLVLIKCVTPPIWGHSLGLFSQLQALWKADPVVQQDVFSDEALLMPQDDVTDEVALVPPAADPMLPGLIAMKDSEVASTPNVPITLPTKTADSSFIPEATPSKPSWPMILLSLVASGAVLTISIMVVRCVRCLRHIQRHRTEEFDESLNEQLQRLAKMLRVRRVPRIVVSDVLFGPAVIGLWSHVIVLPRCLLKAESGERKADDLSALSDRLSAVSFPLSSLDPILAHELLHIRRGDLRTGTLQAIVQSLWWFHPAVWLCNRWLSREAERCCDEQVIAELGCSPAQYARCLLSVIESKHALQPIPVFPGMKPVEITYQRMERIMSLKSNLKKQTPLWCWLTVAALAIVVLPGATESHASFEKEHGSAKTIKVELPMSQSILLQSLSDMQLQEESRIAIQSHIRVVQYAPNDIGIIAMTPGTMNFKVKIQGQETPVFVEVSAREGIHQASVDLGDISEISTPKEELETLQLGEPLVIRKSIPFRRTAISSNVIELVQRDAWTIVLKPKVAGIATVHLWEEGSKTAQSIKVQVTDKMEASFERQKNTDEFGKDSTLPSKLPRLDLRLDGSLVFQPRAPIDSSAVVLDINDKPVEVKDLLSEASTTALLNPISGMEELDRIKLVMETREQVSRRLLSTDQHTPWQIMSGIEGLRRDMLLKNGDTTVNALEWIQAGPVYQGEPWFQKTEHGGRAHPFSKPYWFEGHVNQFLSKLAACRLPLDATFGTPDGPITTQDMINHAKMVVNDKEAVSWTLLALCRYLPPDAKWTNAKGEEWSIERLVEIEVGKPVGGPSSPNGGTDGLYALAVARNEYLNTGKPLEGVWLKADEKIRKYIDLAKSQQNPDGTLSSDFFRSGQRKEHFDKRLSSTSHLLQFLMHAVSDEQLKEDWIGQAVETTASDIQVNRKEYVACDPLFTAAEALTTYLERTQGISLGLVASPLPMNVASRETSAIETVASSNDQPSQLSTVLIGPAPEQNENAATLQKSPVPLTLITYYVGDLVTPVSSGDRKPDFASIVELIKATIEPDSWHDGAAIEVVRDNLSLVVRQSPQIHDRIEALLQEVRKETRQIQVSCRLMKLTTDEQLKGVQERCSMHPLNDHKSWALLTKSRSDEVIRSLNNKHTDVLMDPIITTYSGMMVTIQIDPEEEGNRWLRSLGFGSGTTTTLFRGCALGVEPRIIGDSSVIRLKHSVYLNLNPQQENASVAVTGNEGTAPLSIDESLVSSGQTLLLLIDTTKVNTKDAALDRTSDPQNGTRGKYVVMLTVERLEEEEEQVRQ